MNTCLRLFVCAALLSGAAAAQSFVNWETPHVHPIDRTPDGSHILAVNTADNRVEIFSVSAGGIANIGSVATGLDPVSVRARTDSEIWVVNHISDTISIIDLPTRRIRATIATGDEPCDVVFAGSPERAFVTVSQLNQVRVFDPANLTAAPVILTIAGEDPRALATDGTRVFAAIHDSGNRTTVIDRYAVSSGVSPYAGQPNPPPNSGADFVPPLNGSLPVAPPTALIVKKGMDNAWRDDNGGDWSAAVTWDLHDHDVAVIDVNSLAVTYAAGLMNLNMAIALGPAGQVSVVGTDALNHIRFEPNVNGRFLRVQMANFDPGNLTVSLLADLNPQLDYSTTTVPQAIRDLAIGDPRAVVWNASGTVAYIAGMGSDNVVAVASDGTRLGQVDVPEGPTGLLLDDSSNRLFVLSKFDASVSIIDTGTLTVSATVPLYDPTPATIRSGRPHLYSTHATSGLGHVSCGSCHIDGRMDQLAWDLGDPSGAMKAFNQVCTFGGGGCEDWHPMKGPLVTQTLVGIIGDEPLHWRGDREDLAAFNPAFESLLGDDTQLTVGEMAEFVSFVNTIRHPPNPFRNFNGGLPASVPGSGNAVLGVNAFNDVPIFAGTTTCVTCHLLPAGTTGDIIPRASLSDNSQSLKIPQAENLYEKSGFDKLSSSSNRGFGYSHDGSIDSIRNFLQLPVFQFSAGPTGDQERLDMEAYMLAFSIETHPAVGRQTTLINASSPAPGQLTLISSMISQANLQNAGLVARIRTGGLTRGYRYNFGAGVFQSDRAAETVTFSALQALATPGSELTYTMVPFGSQTRIGIDRDEDGFFDRDELDACSDPSDPLSTPLNSGPPDGDLNGDLQVDLADLAVILSNFGIPSGATPAQGELTGDGAVDLADLAILLASYGQSCPAE